VVEICCSGADARNKRDGRGLLFWSLRPHCQSQPALAEALLNAADFVSTVMTDVMHCE